MTRTAITPITTTTTLPTGTTTTRMTRTKTTRTRPTKLYTDISILQLDDESIAKIIFLKIDPIIKIVLRTIKEYHNHRQMLLCSIDNIDNNTQKINSTTKFYETSLQLLQIISTNLLLLHDMFVDDIVEPSSNKTDQIEQQQDENNNNTNNTNSVFYYNNFMLNKQHVGTSLVLLYDYISLPLLTLLRIPQNSGIQHKQSKNSNNSKYDTIVASAIWKCIYYSTITLQLILDCIYFRNNSCDDSDKNRKDNNIVVQVQWSLLQQPEPEPEPELFLLSNKMITKTLVALATALPSSSSSTTSYHNNDSNNNKLMIDTGEQYIECLFTTIHLFLQHLILRVTNNVDNENNTNNNNSYIQQLSSIIGTTNDYALIVRILDSAIVYIEPNQQQQLQNQNQKTTTITTHNTYSRQLVLSAIHVINTILDMSLLILQNSSNGSIQIVWYKVFPGVYAGIYRRIIQSYSISTIKGSSIIIESIQILCKLLQVSTTTETTSNNSNCNNNATTTSMTTALEQLLYLSKTTSNNNNYKTIPQPATTATTTTDNNTIEIKQQRQQQYDNNNGSFVKNEFYKQLYQRVPSTIITLINLLSVSKLSLLRQQCIHINRTILITTSTCWLSNYNKEQYNTTINNNNNQEGEGNTNLIVSASESTLILSQDNNIDVSTNAKELLMDYLHLTSTNNDMISIVHESIIEKIVSLLESLPTFVLQHVQQQQDIQQQLQPLRDVELRTTIKLLSGYIELNISNKSITKLLRVSLSTETTIDMIRKSIGTLFKVNFDPTESKNNSINSNINSALVTIIPTISESFRNETSSHLHCTSLETQNDIIHMIKLLGQLLGSNYTAIHVDNCLYNMYQTLTTKDNNTYIDSPVKYNSGYTHTIWLHENIGSIEFIKHLLIGTFESNTINQTSQRYNKKASSRLLDIARSILPIITSSPLWNLPTTTPPTTNSAAFMLDTQFRENEIRSDNKKSIMPINVTSRSIILGNTILIERILDLIQSICSLSGQNSIQLVPMVLYPVLEKTASTYPSSISNRALDVLQTIVHVNKNKFSTVAELLIDNIGMIVGIFLQKLRIPGGLLVSRDPISNSVAIIDELSPVTSFFQLLVRGVSSNSTMSTITSWLSTAESITTEFITHFDCLSSQLGNSTEYPVCFLNLFNATMELLLCSRQKPIDTTSVMNEHPTPWIDILNEFKKDEESLQSSEYRFREAFVHNEQQTPVVTEADSDDMGSLKRDTAFACIIAIRCCCMLSHPSLHVQLASSTTLTKFFQYLGRIASDPTISKEESNGPTTAILRLVHTSWPAIVARVKAMITEVNCSDDRSLIISTTPITNTTYTRRSSTTKNVGQCKVYLAKLYDLITEITVCADDFMATRFRHAVWPCLCDTLGQYLRTNLKRFNQRKKSTATATTNQSDDSLNSGLHYLPLSDKVLIQSVMKCISQTFQHHPTGIPLQGLIPSIGTVLVPFLDYNDEETVQSCIDVFHSMLRIDCDSLYGLLLKLCNQFVESCPVIVHHPHNKSSRQEQQQPSTNSTKVQAITQQLLDFIDTLPEQVLD